MGSDPDWKVIEDAAAALDEFGTAYEVDVVSAHQMPGDMVEYGRKASERGLRAIIAGAGGAAHLPGVFAVLMPLPTIGVPASLWHFDGMGSLLSIVQMPVGVSVATASTAGTRNTGLLVAHIIGSAPTDRDVRDRMATSQDGFRETARTKGAMLRGELGG